MDNLIELKKLLKFGEVRKIKNTTIVLGKLNFNHGTIEEYPFVVDYIAKRPYNSSASEDDYKNQVIMVYGTIFYAKEHYKHAYKLTYTDDDQIAKLIEPTKEGEVGTFDSFLELRKY